MKPPDFWTEGDSPLARLLTPLGWAYAGATAWRLAHGHPWRAPVPVICVGNLTAGGAGKTPVVRDIAARLSRMGQNPAILSRGYGGRMRGPVRVDPALHSARDVGDEPLLLARDAPCWVAADRELGAKAMIAAGAGFIVMDDGLQNPSLAQDLRLIVVDGAAGFGNGRPIPAGPLRETVAAGLARADAMIVMGEDSHGLVSRYSGILPVLRASVKNPDLAGGKLLAFAGIGRPGKFQVSLIGAGADIAEFHPFADHHFYREAELSKLTERAAKLNAKPVTTEKDWVRLSPEWQARVTPVRLVIQWQDEDRLSALLEKTLIHVR
jgi:tetraacyldisaccharide 4'-kinase